MASVVHAPFSAKAQTIDIETATVEEIQNAITADQLTAVRLVQQYLDRIAAYDAQGPAINALIAINPNALAEATALDAEREAGSIRGPLQGIPIILQSLRSNAECFGL